MKDHIEYVKKFLERFEEVDLTLSIDKTKFGVDEILVAEHLCGRCERKPNPKKVDVIVRIKACSSIIVVRRFFGSLCFLSDLDSTL